MLTDVASYPKWWPARFGVSVLEMMPGLLGTEIEVRPRLTRSFRCRFEEAEPPNTMRVRFFGGVLEGPCYLVLDRLEGATRVRVEIDVFVRGAATAILAFFFPFERLHGFQSGRVLRALRARVKAISRKSRRGPSAATERAGAPGPTDQTALTAPAVATPARPPDVHANLDWARAYLKVLQTSAPPEELTGHFHEDATSEEFANGVCAEAVRDFKGILEARARSRALWSAQTYDVFDITAGGSQVALEVLWKGVVAHNTDILEQGQEVEARLAIFLKFKDRRIVRQRTYISLGPHPPGSIVRKPDENGDEDVSPARPARANFEAARRFLAALSEGCGPDEMARFFSEDAIQEALPSRLNPNGDRRDLLAMKSARAAGLVLFPKERHDLCGAAGNGSRVAMEVQWTGVAAVDRPPFVRGQEVESRSAVFLEFRDGLIAGQRNYDCVAPGLAM